MDPLAFLKLEDPVDIAVTQVVADKAGELLDVRLQNAVARALGG